MDIDDEKKQRIEMAKYFEHLQDTATVDNFLAGTSHRPQASSVPATAGQSPQQPARPALRETPDDQPTTRSARSNQWPSLRQVAPKR